MEDAKIHILHAFARLRTIYHQTSAWAVVSACVLLAAEIAITYSEMASPEQWVFFPPPFSSAMIKSGKWISWAPASFSPRRPDNAEWEDQIAMVEKR